MDIAADPLWDSSSNVYNSQWKAFAQWANDKGMQSKDLSYVTLGFPAPAPAPAPPALAAITTANTITAAANNNATHQHHHQWHRNQQ